MSLKVVTWLVSLATLAGFGVRAGFAIVYHIQMVQHAVQDTTLARVEAAVVANTLHLRSIDSLLVSGQIENRNILCYLAKSPPAMVAAGTCHKQ